MRCRLPLALFFFGIAMVGAGEAVELRIVGPVDDAKELRAALVDIERAKSPALDEVFARAAAAGWPWTQLALDAKGEILYVRPGPRARLRGWDLSGPDERLSRQFVEGAHLRAGDLWRPGRWERALRDGLAFLGESGHPFAAASLQRVEADSSTGQVNIVIWVAAGPPMRFGELRAVGEVQTRETSLARLAGMPSGDVYRESALRDVRERLLARDIVDEVHSVEPHRAAGSTDLVDLVVTMTQPEKDGRFAAAIGLVEDRESGETRISGSVDLEMLDLFGTARQFRLAWMDDGRFRRRLDARYMEPAIFASPLDLVASLGQRHEDDRYDTFLVEGATRVPLHSSRTLEIGIGYDRTTFETGSVDEARVRVRRRALAAIELRLRRVPSRALFGSFTSRVQAAQVRESGAGSTDLSPPSQTLIDVRLESGWALRPKLALLTRAAWVSVETDELPLPEGERVTIGGASTVRGYAEDQFRGERTAFGGVELELGSPGGGRAYAFLDLGWVREHRDFLDEVVVSEQDLLGFGLGLRSPSAFGSLDLSLGFAEKPTYANGKLHIRLVQQF